MTQRDAETWTPFRPTADDLKAISEDVSEVRNLQRMLLDRHRDLHTRDRVAHQYQIAGGKVVLRVADDLPARLRGIGLFEPGAEHTGIGRISTGLGTPHVEPGLDFLGLMLAFQTRNGQRVDFLGLNDPAAPTDDHRAFLDVLHATADSADAGIPHVGALGSRDLPNLAAEQTELFLSLRKRMGVRKALKTTAHLFKQTKRTFLSATACQAYWTGIVEIGGTAGKFTLVPSRDDAPREASGERRLTDEWKARQGEGDVEFALYWIAFLDEKKTSTRELTEPWEEEHKERVGTVTFPRADLDSAEARQWAVLASEMGANPGNWVRDRENTIEEPATPFGAARKIAYQMSQEGRNALAPESYRSVFETGRIGAELAQELEKRRAEKEKVGHVGSAPAT